jgi:hypothetical protein
MPDQTRDQDQRGFMFTDEDFARRYAGEDGGPEPLDPAPPAAGPRLHGGGNAFMRARRRRLAASRVLRRF